MKWLRYVKIGLLAIVILGFFGSSLHAEQLKIEQAVLVTVDGDRNVNLPHSLATSDFQPDGSTVIYRLIVDNPVSSGNLQAIYIAKVSLSARLFVNGDLAWSCGAGDLSELRCLHRPHLIQLPVGLMEIGRNVLEFEVFADGRQINGLSAVFVGSYDELFREYYRWARFIKVDMLYALAIFAGVAGLLSFSAGIVEKHEYGFSLFAIVALLEALSIFLMTAVNPPGERLTASWLIFNTRYVGVGLKLFVLYQAFDRLKFRDPLVAGLLLLTILGPILLGLSNSDRRAVLVLYALLGVIMAVTVVQLLLWTFAAPTWRNISWTVTAAVIFFSSLHDYLRLGGAAEFDGVYVLYYVFPLSVIVMCSILFIQMGEGLRLAQSFTETLRREVAERTSALESALASIRNLEASALSLTRNIPIGTFILKTWGRESARYAFFSDRMRQLINLPQEAEPPLLIRGSDLLHPDDAEMSRKLLLQALDEASRFEAEFRVRGAQGDWRWLRCIMLPQDGNSSPVIWDGVVIDVTEARQAEERLRAASLALVESAVQKSRAEERERLLQDMHDGFGSQLSSARLAIEQGQLEPATVAQILMECSEDLRIMVDTLGNEDGDLNHAIADFRYRLDRRFVGTGIRLTWDIAVPEGTRLPPTQILHILRVLQEAKNNALRHSGARSLEVTLKVAEGHLTASVRDDGHGFIGTHREGRGMLNMRKRCREIGAHLRISSTGRGTLVLVTMEVPDGL